MDPAFILGIIIAFGALFAMITMEGASLNALLLPAPMILVLGSTIGVGIASHTFRDTIVAVTSLGGRRAGRARRRPRSSPRSSATPRRPGVKVCSHSNRSWMRRRMPSPGRHCRRSPTERMPMICAP